MSRFSRFLFSLAAAAAWWPLPLGSAAPPPPGGPGAAGDPLALEEEGDGWRRKAEPAYRRAEKALEMSQLFSERLADAPAAARALRERGGLLVTLLDSRSFLAAGEKVGTGGLAPLPLPLTLAAEGAAPPPAAGATPVAEPGEEGLRFLATFLGEAGRTYFRSAEKEMRDLPLIFEALALCERFLGDFYQTRADGSYRRALLALAAADPRGAGARVRLRYKLRDLEGAREELSRSGLDETLLAGNEKVELLRIQRDLARFGGARSEALAFDGRLLQLGDKAEEVPRSAPPLRLLTGAAVDLSRFAEALLSISATRRLSPRERVITEYLAGMATMETGQPAAAAEVLETALREVASRQPQAASRQPPADDDPWLLAGIASRLGEARDSSGDFEGAVAGFEKALAALEGLAGVERYRARVALNAAASLFSLGQLEDARRAALEVLSEKTTPGDLRVRSRILLAGILYASAGESPEALEDTLSVLALAERERADAKLPDAVSEELRALVLVHAGNVHRKLALAGKAAPAERAEAHLCMERALQAAGRIPGLERLAASCSANLAELAIEAGDLVSARRFAGSALAAASARHAFETEWRCHWYLSRIHDAEGDLPAADREIEEAARIVESHRERILGSDRKAGFMASKVKLYEAMASRDLARGDGPAAFLAAERSRARSFVESLGLRLLLLGTDRDRAIYREYINLLSRVEERADRPGELFGIRAMGSYDEFRTKLEALKKKIRESPEISPLVHSLVEGEPATAESVKRGLAAGEHLVEFFAAGNDLVAFVAGGGSFAALPLAGVRREVEREARKFAEGSAGDAALASSLGERLIAPVLREIAKDLPQGAGGGAAAPVPTLIVVPWGELHRVPFEALRVGGRYLIESHAVAYLPAASVLKYLEKGSSRRERPERFIAFVDPSTVYDASGVARLPSLGGAQAEVAGIAPLFPDSKVLPGKEASESSCRSQAPGREVIHLACHGEFHPSRPLDSRLYLSRDSSQDGLLHVSEIYGIDFRGSRLVALSGCETGRTEVGAGEDPVGIGTAFLQAGAGALLVSLWKVEDQATAELMKSFYRKWLDGSDGNRALALQEAKLEFLRGRPRAAPRQWAAFVLIGSR